MIQSKRNGFWIKKMIQIKRNGFWVSSATTYND